MRILGHMYHLGWGWGGGVVTMCLVLEDLRRRGHSVGLMLQRGEFGKARCHGARVFGITDVYSNPLPRVKRREYEKADIVITQGEATTEALALCRQYRKPLAHMIHDEGQLATYKVKPEQCQLAIYNAEWVKAAALAKGRNDNAIVVYPYIEPADYRVERTGECITLVNLCEEKGGKLFWELVKRMPDRKFLGVKGGWGGQIVPTPVPANAQVLEHSLDPREVYRNTRIILMPSQDLGTPGMRWWTESYGRIGIEAAASGIPTIAHPTPGLLESLGEAGIFANRHRPEEWVEAIEALDDEEAYRQASEAALLRSKQLMPTEQMNLLEAELIRIGEEYRVEMKHTTEDIPNKLVKARALRRMAGRGPIGSEFLVTSPVAEELLNRHLIEIIEIAEESPQQAPEETEPQEIKSSVTMTYRHERGPLFENRNEYEIYRRSVTAGKAP